MEEQEFLTCFENLSLDPEHFDHKGHLRLGWLYMRDYGLGEACKKLNHGIDRFAKSLGAHDKFHLTMTTAFACAIKSRFRERETFEEFLESNADLVDNAMKLIHSHYSPELLSTHLAKIKFVQPDRDPFPRIYDEQIREFCSS